MPGHSLTNLRTLEDAAAQHGMGEGFEARFARDAVGAETIGLSLQRFAPGVRAPFAHRHRDSEELYVVTAGGGRALVDGELVDLRAWDVLRVAPEAVRSFEGGPDGLEILAFGTRSGEEGSEMVHDAWPQEGT